MALAQRYFLAFLMVGPRQAWLRPGLSGAPSTKAPSAPPSSPLSRSWEETSPREGSMGAGSTHWQCPTVTLAGGVTATAGKPSLGRTASTAGAPWARHSRGGKPATKTACGQRQGLGSAQEGRGGRAGSPGEVGPGCSLPTAPRSMLRVPPSLCSELWAATRGQRTARHRDCDTTQAASHKWGSDPNPGLTQYTVNYKINPLPPFVIKRAADWTCIFLALQNKAPELKNETPIVFDIKGIPTC